MRLLAGRTLGTIATVLVLGISLLAFAGGAMFAVPGTTHSAAASSRAAPHLTNAVHPLATVPAAPTGLSVVADRPTMMSLAWTNPSGGGLVNDTVYVGTTCGTWTGAHSTGGAALTYLLTGLTSGTSYCLAVSAWNATGESNLSANITMIAGYVPAAPTNLSAVAITPTSIDINWTAPSGGGLVDYTVGVGYTCTDLIWNFTTVGPVLTYTTVNLQSHINYCFRVSAWNSTAQSNLSKSFQQLTRYIPGAPFISVLQFTTALPLYSNVGQNLAFRLVVANQSVGANNTVLFVQVSFPVTGAPVNNISMESELKAGNTTNFNITLDPTTVPAAVGTQFEFTAWAKVNNSINGTTYGSGAGTVLNYLVLNTPTATVISPNPSFVVGPGNQTVVVQYSGDFINSASVNITTSTGAVVYTESVFAVGGGVQTVAAVAPWTVTASGTYKVTIQIGRPFFGASSWSWNVTAVVPSASQGFIFVNTTKYINTTVTNNGGSTNIDGLAPGVLAAVLLVAGLIIGLIVALALGRMMWGGSKPGAPQAWSAKPSNECSVCHQTFATEDELKEHAKSAHGM